MPVDFQVVYAVAGTNGAPVVRQISGSSPKAMAVLAGATVGHELVLDIRATVRPGHMRRRGARFELPAALPADSPPATEPIPPAECGALALLHEQRDLLTKLQASLDGLLERPPPPPPPLAPIGAPAEPDAPMGAPIRRASGASVLLGVLLDGPIEHWSRWAWVATKAGLPTTPAAINAALHRLVRRGLVHRPRRGCVELTPAGRKAALDLQEETP